MAGHGNAHVQTTEVWDRAEISHLLRNQEECRAQPSLCILLWNCPFLQEILYFCCQEIYLLLRGKIHFFEAGKRRRNGEILKQQCAYVMPLLVKIKQRVCCQLWGGLYKGLIRHCGPLCLPLVGFQLADHPDACSKGRKSIIQRGHADTRCLCAALHSEESAKPR